MTLEKYFQKRDFDKTPEPRGEVVKAGKKLSFVIQKHDARNLHYDFRLELDGTLKSWAVPKGPSLDPADKRLAVHVEDHPLAYGSFEGEIPAHQYGAGTVLLWDRGDWIPDGDPAEGYRTGRLKFHLQGNKLSGGWTLVRMGTPKEKKENWLLIKERDAQARTGEDADIVGLRPESVVSGIGQKTIRAKVSPAKPKSESKSKPKPSSHASPQPEGATESAMPASIAPQLATLSERAPVGVEWLSELKFDGYRALCRIDDGKAHIFTRAGNDWTKKWPTVAAALAALPVQQAWLDGEVVAVAKDGAVSFQALQNSMRSGASEDLKYYVFDLLYLNGYDVRNLPLVERKTLLKSAMSEVDPEGALIYSEHVTGDAGAVFSHACMHGLEGIVAKRSDAPYESGRSRTWLKVKCSHRQEFVIGGYTDPAGTRTKFGALLVGVFDREGQFNYAGRVGTGFDQQTLTSLKNAFSKLSSKTTPFSNPPTGREAAGVHWLKPTLVAEVKFAEWTDSSIIRHASFIGLRSDKPAREIVREAPLPAAALDAIEQEADGVQASTQTTARGKKGGRTKIIDAADTADPTHTDDGRVAGVALSHPSRILFAEAGLSKFQLAKYYEEVASWILPHLTQRPLTLVRCPHGGGQQCFFQKHATESTAKEIEGIEVPSGDGSATYMMANSLPALISLVQIGVLELHTWGAHNGSLDKPDRIIFDLDPAPELPWMQVVEAAQLIRSLLDDIGLRCFVKTTGGKGLHVVVPLKPEKSWDDIKAFSRAIAEHLEQTIPDRFTSSMSKAKRPGKIFIDYLRNASEATAVAAYSTRAQPGAPVSTPLAWDELGEEIRSDTFTVATIRTRLENLKQDPWAEYFSLHQRITVKMLRAFGCA